MINKLHYTYFSDRQLANHAAPQIIHNGYITTDAVTLFLLGLQASVFSLAQSLETRHYEVWENWIELTN